MNHIHWNGTANLLSILSLPVALAAYFGDGCFWVGVLLLVWLAVAWCKASALHALRKETGR